MFPEFPFHLLFNWDNDEGEMEIDSSTVSANYDTSTLTIRSFNLVNRCYHCDNFDLNV